MLGTVAASYVASAPPTAVDPIVLATAAMSFATAVADAGIAKSALEPGGDTLDVGDLLIAFPKINSTTATWQSKVGDPAWTLFAQNNVSASSAVLRRIVDGTEPATLTFTRSNSTSGGELDIWRIKAGTFDPANPLDVATFIAPTVSALVLASIVTTVARTLLIQSVSRVVAATGQSWLAQGDQSGTPGNPTELYDVTAATNNMQAAGGAEQLVSVGATGTRTWTQTGTGNSRGAMVAVRSKP